jgi:hypothetical protein
MATGQDTHRYAWPVGCESVVAGGGFVRSHSCINVDPNCPWIVNNDVSALSELHGLTKELGDTLYLVLIL